MAPEASSPNQPYQPPAVNVPQAPYHTGGGTRKGAKKWLLIAGAILIVAAAAVSGYLLLKSRKTAPTPPSSSNSSAQQSVVPDANTNSGSTTYVSNGKDLNLRFTYPSAWTTTPQSNTNTNDQPIIVSSPRVSLPDATGSTVTGRIVVSIRPSTATISELSSGATAAQASVQIAYTKPTTSQHQYPYLTFIHLKNGSNPSGAFEEVMVTGITTFANGQAITNDSLGQLDPIISARFYACPDTACDPASAPPLSTTFSSWQNNDAFQAVQKLFESLQIQ